MSKDLKVKVRLDTREAVRTMNEFARAMYKVSRLATVELGWLFAENVRWNWPWWAPRGRPYDWSIDGLPPAPRARDLLDTLHRDTITKSSIDRIQRRLFRRRS